MRNLLWIAPLVAQASIMTPARPGHGRDATDAPNQKRWLGSRATAGHAHQALQCFQVTNPVLSPDGIVDGNELLDSYPGNVPPESCQVRLMEHVFGNSYGQPFVAEYAPPDEAKCPFNRVIMNFTVVSEGRQFDRLAIMWLGDTEVWRTSTAEPEARPGITWTYWKDMTTYLSMWKRRQKIIFDLGNIVNRNYTGSFNTTLTATFIRDQGLTRSAAPPADEIVPLSAGNGATGKGSAFTYPDEKAEKTITLPRNVGRAVLSIAATGQSDEEFWWTNVPEDGINNWEGTTLLGKGSFREVRLRIDGQLAGLSWPYPVVFTGGISPPLHRPVVGPQAFDLKEQEIDITPWLGVLCNGDGHTFGLEVVGAEDAVVNRYWLLSGKIFLWLDGEDSITSGHPPNVTVSEPNYNPREEAVREKVLRYDQTISRTLEIKSEIKRTGGNVFESAWSQRFAMRSTGCMLDAGNIQKVDASYEGEDRATRDSALRYYAAYSYPMQVRTVQTPPDDTYTFTLDTNLTQTMKLAVTGDTVFSNGLEPFLARLSGPASGSVVQTTKKGRAFFFQKKGNSRSGGFGSTRQTYDFGAKTAANRDGIGSAGVRRLYSREVIVSNETTMFDGRWILGKDVHQARPQERPQQLIDGNGFAAKVGGRKWQGAKRSVAPSG
ncbi:peptide-N4-(N-acetyl-beta-glucosaminyl)asparagine amidase A [Metarhizium album ARSEF 1941]|uniref:Peptide-N4-(N-acetyl-beta-glucosaminyl)asparagine amidase A n=1 Tax=Metarhizium album (strain ARSEF 1941) TaxID=1081103 RepID=A0A0B2WLP5_METAS|nr:peptide-N4-(N-acetyl-beta-glucosaminyl)asparagine amidase A [Metarhizium album ARSEF 1941]KHN96981.1 peptide-N4-(N-acetyl-beta-glucosaminyl)asparagine amidase A [Metarhizium album ARSEF 1941]